MTTHSIAIATTQNIDSAVSGSRLGSCGLVKWCYSVARLIVLPYLAGRSQAFITTNDAPHVQSLCARSFESAGASPLRIERFDESLVALVRGWATALNYTGYVWTRQLSLAALYKLQMFRHTEYRAILFTDADVDFWLGSGGRPPRARTRAGRMLERAWTTTLDRFLNSSAELVASSDFHSPINTGVMLLRPSSATYARASAVLARRQFDRVGGFDGAGSPRAALAHLNGTSLWYNVAKTVALKVDDWNFVGGHACQGLFVHVFLVQPRASDHPWHRPRPQARACAAGEFFDEGTGACASKPWPEFVSCAEEERRGECAFNPQVQRHCAVTCAAVSSMAFRFPAGLHERRRTKMAHHKVHHFSGGAKPWRGPSRCAKYFEFLRDEEGVGDGGAHGSAAGCIRSLRQKRDCLQPGLSADACRACRRQKLAHYANTSAIMRSSTREYTCMTTVPRNKGKNPACTGTSVMIF